MDSNGNTVPGKLSPLEQILRNAESWFQEDLVEFDSRWGWRGTMHTRALIFYGTYRASLIGVTAIYLVLLIPAIGNTSSASLSAGIGSTLNPPPTDTDTISLAPLWITVPLLTLATYAILKGTVHSDLDRLPRGILAAILTAALLLMYFGYLPALIPMALLGGWWIWLRRK